MSDELIELPESWEWTTLGEFVLNIQYGHTASATYEPVGPKFLRITDLQDNSVDWKSVPFCECDEVEKYKLAPGDIVVARTGATTGKSFLLKDLRETTVFASYLIRLHTSSQYPPDYLAWFMQSTAYWQQITTVSKGTAQPGANASILSNLTIPLPPLNEQKRIVAKIEELNDRHQTAKQALEAVPKLCDRFCQSVLAAAFRGDLTADWREENPDVEPASVLLERISKELGHDLRQATTENDRDNSSLPDSWAWGKFKLFVKDIQAGKNFACPEIPVAEDTIGLVKISAVTWGRFDFKETKTVADASKIDSNLFIQKGDFLISRANTLELVGASVIVDEINYKIMLSDKVWRVDFLEVDKRFINFYLKSLYGRREIESRATGNQLSMRNISQTAFKEIDIALPPLQEQQEIVCQIEALFRSVNLITQQYQNSENYLDRLNQSILAKAFRGELVEQDPNDEPASVLLDRIRSERQAQEGKKSGGARGKRKQASRDQLDLPGVK